MLLDKFLLRVSRTTLFVVLGAQHIHCGVMKGESSRANWITDSLFEVGIDSTDDVELPIQGLIAALQRLPTLAVLPVVDQVRVVVADCWLAMTGIPWTSSVKHAASADAYARAQLVGAGFDIERSDTLRVDDAPFGEPRLAIAYPALMMSGLNQLASDFNACLTSVLPMSFVGWEFVRRKPGTRPQALALLDTGLTLFARGAGIGSSSLCDVMLRMSRDDHLSALQRLDENWQRLCLRDPQLVSVKHIALLDLAKSDVSKCDAGDPFVRVALPEQEDATRIPPALCLAEKARTLHHALDALPVRAPFSLGRWLLLVVVAVIAGALVVQALQMHRILRSYDTRLNAAANIAQSTTPSKAWSREELARIQAVNTAIRELNLPISPILRALQPPSDIRVAVLGVETAGGVSNNQTPAVKIVAEARTGTDMTRYVAFIAERKPFTSAYLTRHEIDESSIERPYRFTVEALWSE